MNAPRRRVAILVHAHDHFPSNKSLIELLMRAWSENGFEVSVVRDANAKPMADAAVLHVNLTRIPPEYLALAARYPVVVNGAVTDISKRVVCTHLVARGDGYDGPVIVKTDRNFGGAPERAHARRTWPGRMRNRVADFLPWTWSARLRPAQYPVFDSPRAVPAAVWRNSRLVVQRYLCERRGEFNCMRQWVFFGAAERSVILYSRHAVIKAKTIDHQEDLADVPDTLRALRRKLGFDYGKFDYGVVDGELVMYDANRTPTYSQHPPSAQTLETVRYLAGGLDGLLR